LSRRRGDGGERDQSDGTQEFVSSNFKELAVSLGDCKYKLEEGWVWSPTV